jgi:hypothetical protein
MAAYVELFVDQGANFNNVINLTDEVTNLNVNVQGYTVISQMKRSYYSANASANITCSITNALNGEIAMTMDANTTANIKAGRYLFDMRVTDRGGVVSRVLEGIITVTPRISR